MSEKEILRFPEGFLWGTATAGHQVEGNNIHSDWWEWEKKHKNIEDSGIACDHYHKYRDDFKLAKELLHNNAHRFSIEWSRIEPGKGQFDQAAVEHYRNVLEELKKLGLKTVVTLHHFVLPLWFAEEGGFSKKENLYYFLRYVGKCAEEYTDLVDYWCIFNEPNVYVGGSYVEGKWPPQKKKLWLAIKVFLNMALAHKKAYRLIHKVKPDTQVCSVIHMADLKALSVLSKPLLPLVDLIFNQSFLKLTKNNHDFLGINCYGVHIVSWLDIFFRKIKFSEIEKIEKGEHSDIGWPIYPQAIYNVVKRVWGKYKKPIIITENGVADVNDKKRPKYIINYLTWLWQAIEEGVDVKGYFHWTLMDNFEWHLGREACFGLFETDYKTLERKPRGSASFYGKIAGNNGITS